MPAYTRRVMQDATVFEEPDETSKTLGVIAARHFVRVLDVQRTWLHVQDMANVKMEGYISVKTLTPARGAAKDVPGAPTEADLDKEADTTPSGPDDATLGYDNTADSPERRAKTAAPPPQPPADTPESVPLAPSEKIISGSSYAEKRASRIWNLYGGLLTALADKYGIDPVDAAAVLSVESGGAAYGTDGRMIIRFEPHLFYRLWGKDNQDKFFNYYQFNKEKNWKDHAFRTKVSVDFAPFHGSQPKEWAAYEYARRLMGQAAKMSMSMGMPQILGSNYRACGYASVDEMFDAFSDAEHGEQQQILGFFKFIENDYLNRGIPALRNQDYVSFAEMYNGPGQAETYGNLIAERVRLLKMLMAA